MQKMNENIDKVLYFILGTEIRPHEGAEISRATDLSPAEINDVVELLIAKEMLVEEAPGDTDPYRFGSVRITQKAIALFQQSRRSTGCSAD
jgi:hypothetical protein